MPAKAIKSITVIGKKWFDKINGNTYHTARVMVDGITVYSVPFNYGYGDQYLWNASYWLDDNGYIELEKYPHGGRSSLWSYCSDHNIHLEYWAVDVPRKKDLQ